MYFTESKRVEKKGRTTMPLVIFSVFSRLIAFLDAFRFSQLLYANRPYILQPFFLRSTPQLSSQGLAKQYYDGNLLHVLIVENQAVSNSFLILKATFTMTNCFESSF